MKYYWLIGWMALFMVSCLDDKDCGCAATTEVFFEMKDVAYIFDGNEIVGLQPYNRVTDRLDIFAFKKEVLDSIAVYDYEYCQNHTVIPYVSKPGSYTFLFIANLFDRKALHYEITPEKMTAWLRIMDHDEPPVYLVDIQPAIVFGQVFSAVELQMLVSRLEVQVINPPAWVEGFHFIVSHIAARINNYNELQDTTSIYKTVPISLVTANKAWVGINTFPTYPGIPAVVSIQLRGGGNINQLVINDERLVFRSGRIIRLSVEFEGESSVKISLNINDKWEIIDEGKIEI